MQSQIHQNQLPLPPSWAAKAIVYEIFPDRFRRSGLVDGHSELKFQSWGADPSLQGFQGGDLYGVIENLDYLQEMGITCIYLTPIFSSAANHRYHTYDYFHVDPLLGGDNALEALIEALHLRGMKILLDGVFNHCGRGFFAFHHLLENGKDSPYRQWFSVHNWPLRPYSNRGNNCGYSCWWNDPALPKFNYEYPPVRDYFLRVATYWIERGIDGWRLDVADEVPLDFWKEFRYKVKGLNSDAWIIGEIWGDARPWLDGEHFDGVMNYRIGWSTISWVAGRRLKSKYRNPAYPLKKLENNEFIEILQTTFGWYKSETNSSQLNLLDSHDVPRALHTLEGDIRALKLALLLLFSQPGAPCIYYGTEAGLSGGAEPKCREGFPWDEAWSVDLRHYILELVSLRSNFPQLYQKGLKWKSIGQDGLLGMESDGAYSCSEGKDSICILINRSRRKWLSFSQSFIEQLFLVGDLDLTRKRVAPQSAVLFKGNFNDEVKQLF